MEEGGGGSTDGLTAQVGWLGLKVGGRLVLPHWLGDSVVERRSLTSKLSLVCTGPAADG